MTAPTELRTSVIRLHGHRITVRRTALRPDEPTGPAPSPTTPAAPAPSRPTDHLEP